MCSLGAIYLACLNVKIKMKEGGGREMRRKWGLQERATDVGVAGDVSDRISD